MKKLLFPLMVLLASCTQSHKPQPDNTHAAPQQAAPPTAQQKAETLVKHYLDSVLHGQGAYQAVSFSKLDTVFFPYTYSPEGARLLREELQLAQQAVKTNTWNSPRLKKVTDSLEYGRQHYQPTHILRYKIAHTYKSKNSSGTLVAATDTFFVDTAFKATKKQLLRRAR